MREIIKVEPTNDYELILTFDNGEIKIKDMKPYLDNGVFQQLKNLPFFESVELKYGTVSWGDSIDMCPDSLYMSSVMIKEENDIEKEIDIIRKKHQKEREHLTDKEVTDLVNNKAKELSKIYGFKIAESSDNIDKYDDIDETIPMYVNEDTEPYVDSAD